MEAGQQLGVSYCGAKIQKHKSLCLEVTKKKTKQTLLPIRNIFASVMLLHVAQVKCTLQNCRRWYLQSSRIGDKCSGMWWGAGGGRKRRRRCWAWLTCIADWRNESNVFETDGARVHPGRSSVCVCSCLWYSVSHNKRWYINLKHELRKMFFFPSKM